MFQIIFLLVIKYFFLRYKCFKILCCEVYESLSSQHLNFVPYFERASTLKNHENIYAEFLLVLLQYPSFASLSVIHVECISSNSPFLLPFVELKQTNKQTNMHIFFDLNFSILIPTQADLGLRSNNKEAAHGFFFLFLLNSDNNFSKYKFTTRSVSISFWKSLVLEVWEYNFLVPFK